MPLTLTTLDEFKLHLRVTGTSEDTQLTQFLIGVEQAVIRATGREFVSTQVTEYYDGNGSDTLPLKRRPLTAVTSVRVDAGGYAGHGTDAFPVSSEWTNGLHFYPQRLDEREENGSLLICINGVWPVGRGNVEVVSTAGYTDIPKDLRLGIHTLAAVVRNSATEGAVKGSETIGRYSYSLLTGESDVGGVDLVQARSLIGRFTEVNL